MDIYSFKPMKKCSSSLIIKEMQVETTFIYCISPILSSIGEAVEGQILFIYCWGEEQTGISLLKGKLEISNKTIERLHIGKIILLPVVYLEDTSPKI